MVIGVFDGHWGLIPDEPREFCFIFPLMAPMPGASYVMSYQEKILVYQTLLMIPLAPTTTMNNILGKIELGDRVLIQVLCPASHRIPHLPWTKVFVLSMFNLSK